MIDDRSLERAARSWIEVGPTRAPEPAVQAALLLIETTPQERDWIPWRFPRMTMPARLAAFAVVSALVLVGLALVGGSIGNPSVTPSPSAAAVLPTASPSTTPTQAPATPNSNDYSSLPGRILVEHLGNAIDLSEFPTEDYNPDRRRFYVMDPADMTGQTAVEFLPGQPSGGKFAADISADGQRIVFQDWAGLPRLYEANLDGTGFRTIPVDCTCSLLYPDYDPAAERIVYVRVEGDESWLEILELATGETTRIESTVGPADDAVPEQPAWSPDGATIAFNRITWGGGEPVVGTVHYGEVSPLSGVLSLLDVASGVVTDLDIPDQIPGDANWSPDSATIVYTDLPASTTGSCSCVPGDGIHAINADGTGLTKLRGWGGPRFTPDGEYILYQDNELFLMRPDGTEARPVHQDAMDLSDLAQGFVYIAHWIDPD